MASHPVPSLLVMVKRTAGESATYLQLANSLAAAFSESPPGSRLPSENELAETHQVSRLTARAALKELERRFMVTRIRGKGTFVARRLELVLSPTSQPSWSEAVRRAGGRPDTKVIKTETIRAPAEIRDQLELPRNGRVVLVERLCYVDGLIAMFGRVWFRADLAPNLEDLLSRGGSMYKLLTSFGYQPRRLWVRSRMDALPGEAAKHLELEGQPALWHSSSCVVDRKTGQRLHRGEGWSRPDVIQTCFQLGDPG
ncbi:GntR family transcriptional regulator [Streptomyces sp. NPDC004752]